MVDGGPDLTPAPVLTFEEVTVSYGRTVALDRLSLSVLGGQVTGLVGPNGAGKTTSLRAAAGLVPRSSGRALVLGIDPERRPVAARRRLGFLPDRPTLPSHLAVDELLLLRGALYGLSRSEALAESEGLARDLGISDLLRSWCGSLSHGQAQRVALAAVLIARPALILVDEPMTALDLESQRAVHRMLSGRAAEGAAVLLTTHTLAHVAALADRVVHLHRGRVVCERTGTRDASELEGWLLESSS